jgi:chromosome segregation ATPase
MKNHPTNQEEIKSLVRSMKLEIESIFGEQL